jgi:diguanylate cyclase (GGDEF)-like protein
MAENVSQLLEQGSIEFEWEHLRLDREIFIAKVLMTVIPEGGKDVIHVVWNDITEQKRAQRRLEYLAYYDALTGLPNRPWVSDRIAREVADTNRPRRNFAVIYLDIDHFKYVNDTHGLEYGDNLLQQVAIRLESALGERATLCRLAADEFVILLFDTTSIGQIDEICELVRNCLQRPFNLRENDLFLTVSIGVSVYPRDGGDGATLIRNADIALHEAKRFGQGSTKFFEMRMRDSLGRYVEIRDALLLGLERREFELHYQPQVCLHTGDVNCVEALVRWNMPGRDLVMPGEFIDIAEESGLIVPLGHWILMEACRQAKIWQSWRGRPLSVAVNLSAAQFRQGDIEDDILAALQRSKLDPRYLELEITESLLLQEDHEIIAKLRNLRERGVRLSIDDFGTGYSSLAYLKQFQVDKLKIDRSFVCDLMSSESDRSIVKAMIELARGLGISTVAEGVEDGAIVDELAKMGCDEVQGYFFSRPLSERDFQHWVTGRRR